MTNIDATSLATVVGGKAASTSTSTSSSGAIPVSPSQSAGQNALAIGGNVLQGCLQGMSGSASKTSSSGGKSSVSSAAQLGLQCALGAGQSFIRGLGSLFGSSSSK